MKDFVCPIEELETIRDYIRWGATRLATDEAYCGHGTDNPWDEAVYLILGSLKISWELADKVFDARLTADEKQHIAKLMKYRIVDRVPVAYLINAAWFAGMNFYIDDRVLIPRSPIAELIEKGFSPWICGDEVFNVLDLCTGSGCIGIACSQAFIDATIDLVDISPAALEVAAINVRKYNLDHRVNIIESDLFDKLGANKYDLIVSNPPYVNAEDIATMPAEYRHEPKLGLSSGEDGLHCITRIMASSGQHLTEYGVLVAEVGNSQEALQHAFPDVPFLWLDLNKGGHGVFVLTCSQLKQYADEFGHK